MRVGVEIHLRSEKEMLASELEKARLRVMVLEKEKE
jgi:hypothetical protein